MCIFRVSADRHTLYVGANELYDLSDDRPQTAQSEPTNKPKVFGKRSVTDFASDGENLASSANEVRAKVLPRRCAGRHPCIGHPLPCTEINFQKSFDEICEICRGAPVAVRQLRRCARKPRRMSHKTGAHGFVDLDPLGQTVRPYTNSGKWSKIDFRVKSFISIEIYTTMWYNFESSYNPTI